MNTPDQPTMVLRSDADLLAAIPFLIGFTPTDSLVVLALQGQRLVFTARVDLPPAQQLPATAAEAVDHIAYRVATEAQSAVLVGFGEHDRVAPIMDVALTAMHLRLVPVRRTLRLTGGRMFCHLDDGCMPLSGVPFDPDASTAPATAVVEGLVALTDRDALVRQLAPVQGSERLGMDEATRQAVARLQVLVAAAGPGDAPPHADAAQCMTTIRRLGAAAVQEAFTIAAAGQRLTDDQAAWSTVLLTKRTVRDDAWQCTDDSDGHVQLWADLTRRARPDLAAAPACLLAYSALLRGNGALANVAVQRALQADPGYSFARVLRRVVGSGAPPQVIRGAFDAADGSAGDARPTVDQPATAPDGRSDGRRRTD